MAAVVLSPSVGHENTNDEQRRSSHPAACRVLHLFQPRGWRSGQEDARNPGRLASHGDTGSVQERASADPDDNSRHPIQGTI